MSVERRRRGYPLKAQPRNRHLTSPGWYLRLRLRWVRLDIDRLERQLADEFATLDTAPLCDELEALKVERDGLMERLSERS